MKNEDKTIGEIFTKEELTEINLKAREIISLCRNARELNKEVYRQIILIEDLIISPIASSFESKDTLVKAFDNLILNLEKHKKVYSDSYDRILAEVDNSKSKEFRGVV